MSEEQSAAAGAPDLEVLETVLAAVDRGEEPTYDLLAQRFPDRLESVRQALEALDSYRSLVESERRGSESPVGPEWMEAGTSIGGFRILGLLGRGGMGTVYRAEAGGVEVALKVLSDDLTSRDPKAVDRFRREAQLAADISHPSLARVLGWGAEGDRVHLAMELVEGRTLGQVLRQLSTETLGSTASRGPGQHIDDAVRLVRAVAMGLAAFHGKGLIHRDVKPSNIILRGAGDDPWQALTCPPVLIDNGLLRPVEATEVTGSQTLLGTPAYLAPEARLGREVDARGDVFSLGAVLHDLLTLTPPGRRRIASAGLARVRLLNPAVDRRLAAVVTRALEERPGLRYANAGALAAELERYLEGASLRALPANPLTRLWLYARRRPARAAWTSAAAAVVMLGVSGLLLDAAGQSREILALGRRAASLERSGDLHGAHATWAALAGRDALFSGWTGGRAQADRAASLVASEFGEICALLDPGRGWDLQTGHEQLRRYLLSDATEEHTELAFRFLVRELNAGSAERQRLSAETVAIYFTIRPLGWGDVLLEEGLDRSLELALTAVASASRPAGTSNEPRYFAAYALSGMTRASAIEGLLRFAAEDDAELRQIVTGSLNRMGYQVWADRGELEVPADLLRRWLIGIERCIEKPGLTITSSNQLQASLHIIAETLRAQESAGTFNRSQLGRSLLEVYLVDLMAAHAERQAGATVEFTGAPGLKDRNGHAGARDFRERRDPAEGFKNLWTLEPTAAGRLVDLDAVPPAAGARRFSFTLRQGRGDLYQRLDDAPMTTVEWWGADRFQNGRHEALELDNPLCRSEVRVTCPIPDQAARATVTIDHEKATRAFVPYRGEARVEVRLWENEPVLERSVPLSPEELRFDLHPDVLTQGGELVLTIRLVGGTTCYWLSGVGVEFE